MIIKLLVVSSCMITAINGMIYEFKNKNIDTTTRTILQEYAQQISAKIAFFEKQNIITITGNNSAINEILNLAKKLDVREPIVIIEILFVSTKDKFQNNYGFDWFGIYNKNKVTSFNFKGIGASLKDYPTPTEPINQAYGNLFVNPEIFNINLNDNFFNSFMAGLKLPITFSGINLNTRRLSDLITALSKSNKLRVIDSTTVTTYSSKSVKFESMRSFPIYALNNVQNDNEPLHQKYSVQYKNEGTRLKIKPRVICNQYIELEIFFDLTELIYGGKHRRTLHHAFGQIITDPPVYKLFRIHQKIILSNDESAIISANSKNSNETILKKVPFLSSMPILGKILTSKNNANQNIEEFILITPRIITTNTQREII